MADTATLTIPQTGMQEVYHHLKVFVRRKRTGKVVVTFDGKCAHFATPEMDIGAPAEGNWPGQASVAMAAIMAIATNPPAQDPLIIRVADGYMHFGQTFSCQCTWRPSNEPLIRLPINYDDGTLMAVPLKYTAEDITTSGLTEHVNKARSRLKGRLKTAVRALAPYHISEESLRAFVDKSLISAGVLNHICQSNPETTHPISDPIVKIQETIRELRRQLEHDLFNEIDADVETLPDEPISTQRLSQLLKVLEEEVENTDGQLEDAHTHLQQTEECREQVRIDEDTKEWRKEALAGIKAGENPDSLPMPTHMTIGTYYAEVNALLAKLGKPLLRPAFMEPST